MGTKGVGIAFFKLNHIECVNGQSVVGMVNCILSVQGGKGEPIKMVFVFFLGVIVGVTGMIVGLVLYEDR